MDEKTFLDEAVRKALEDVHVDGLGGFTARKTYFGVGKSRAIGFPLDIPYASVVYDFGGVLKVSGEAVVGFALDENPPYTDVVSLKDHQEYEREAKKDADEYHAAQKKADRKYDAKVKAIHKKYPGNAKFHRDKKAGRIPSNQVHLADLELLTLQHEHVNFTPLSNYCRKGILIADYSDAAERYDAAH